MNIYRNILWYRKHIKYAFQKKKVTNTANKKTKLRTINHL